MKFTFKAKAAYDQYANRIKKKLDESLYLMRDAINVLTPEDTGELERNNQVEESKLVGQKLVGYVFNETPYANAVEDGLGVIFRYQKPKGNKGWYVGDGVHGYKRALAAMRKQVISMLKAA